MPGDFLFKQGDVGESFFIVISGEVDVIVKVHIGTYLNHYKFVEVLYAKN